MSPSGDLLRVVRASNGHGAGQLLFFRLFGHGLRQVRVPLLSGHEDFPCLRSLMVADQTRLSHLFDEPRRSRIADAQAALQ